MDSRITPSEEGIPDDLVPLLKRILADEYVLLNKTSYCLLDASSPFINDNTPLFAKAYQQLKMNAEGISQLLKHRCFNTSLSIDDIIKNTRLKKSDIFHGKVAAVEIFLDDHLIIINHLENLLTKFSMVLEEEELAVLKQAKERHTLISNNCRIYLKQIFSYKSNSYDKKPA